MCNPLIAEGKSVAAVFEYRVSAAATNCRKAKVCGSLLERRNVSAAAYVMERTDRQNRSRTPVNIKKKSCNFFLSIEKQLLFPSKENPNL